MRKQRRILAALAAARAIFSAAAGETVSSDILSASELETEEIMLNGEEAVTEKDGWTFNRKGFLTGENPGDAYLLEDDENGIWQYSTRDLSIRVTRFREKEMKNIREYCVAEVYATEQSPLFAIMTREPETSPRPHGYRQIYPEELVKREPAMLAMSDDYYGYRQWTRDTKGSTWPMGIIIRNGEIFYRKTRDSSKKRPFPPLDTLAVYGDGSMKTYLCDELTAEEYIEQGATQVFSFGPWLIRDGEINETEAGEKAVYLNYAEPRAAIGMVEPYHYILVVVGIPSDKYIGAKGDWLIAKMQEYGCTEALNLDGGGTASMVFNGKVIIHGRWTKEQRTLGSMIAFGALDSLP